MFAHLRSRKLWYAIQNLLGMVLLLSVAAGGLVNRAAQGTVLYGAFAPYVVRDATYQESIGVEDLGFSDDGWLLTNFSESMDWGYAVIIQPDGRLVIAGSFDGTSRDFGLARLNLDGSLDTTFDSDGRVNTDFLDASDDEAKAVSLQTDGKLVVAGSTYSSATRNDFALARYDPDGSLDATFGSDGRVTTDFYGNYDYASAVVVQTDNKIVAAGLAWNATNDDYDFALARYNPDGSLDISFDGDGIVTTDFSGASDKAYAVILMGDKLVVAGSADNGSNDFALARFNPDGSPDTSFDEDGKVTTDFFGESDAAYALALAGDKLVVAGSANNGSNFDFALARFNANGSPDTSFHEDGKVTTDFTGGNDHGYGLAVEPVSGSLVVAGYTDYGYDNNFALVRYLTNGSLDASFDGDGMVTTDFADRSDWGHAIARQSDGRLVVAGYVSTVAGADLAMARYLTNGLLDTNFDEDGKVVINLFGSSDLGQATVMLPDGKFILAGAVDTGYGADFGVARYYSNGSPDLDFDTDGRVITDVNGSSDHAYAIAVQSDFKFVVAGAATNTMDDDFALVRYNPDGSLDRSLDSDGKVVSNYGIGDDTAYALLVQPDGKLVLAGQAETAAGLDFALVRYLLDGSLDPSFGVGGWVVSDFAGEDDCARAILQLEDGKLLVAGYASNGLDYDFALARYYPNGSLDTGFGAGGWVTTDVSGADDRGYAIVLQADGKIFVAGRSFTGTSDAFTLVRYNDNGSLDNTFSGHGWVSTDISASDDYATAIGIQPDGKLVLAGVAETITGDDFALVRYLPDGSLDTDFSSDGWLVRDFYGGDDQAWGLILEPGGQLVLAGYADNGTDYDFAIVRYR